MIEALSLFRLPLGGGGVHRQDKILSRLVARVFNGFQDVLDGIGIILQVRCKSTFVADSSCAAFCLQKFLKGMVDICGPAESFREAGCASRHDHEFLRIDGIRCMNTAVQNVHHRDRERISIHTAEKTVERKAQSL